MAAAGGRAVLVALMAWLPLGAHADYACSVKVLNVLIYADGSVNVVHSGRGDYTVVCNLNTERLGVSPVTCSMWAAMLQHIKKKDGTAHLWFAGDGSCATLPTYWNSPAPVYIGDVNQ